MITVEQLIEQLKNYNPKSEVRFSNGLDVKNIIDIDNIVYLGNTQPTHYCNKCGNEVYSDDMSKSDGYDGYCPHCDEDLYVCEINERETPEKETDINMITKIYNIFIQKSKSSKEDTFYPDYLISRPKSKRGIDYIVLGDYDCEVVYFSHIHNCVGIISQDDFNDILIDSDEDINYIYENLLDETPLKYNYEKDKANECIDTIINTIINAYEY